MSNDVRRRAANNVRREMGFECPTCTRYMPRGTDVCYNCGDMPSGNSYDNYIAPDDGSPGILTAFFYFWAFMLAPIMYSLAYLTEDITKNVLNFLFILPNIILFIASMTALLKKKSREDLGCLSLPIRIWVLTFSTLSLIIEYEYVRLIWFS